MSGSSGGGVTWTLSADTSGLDSAMQKSAEAALNAYSSMRVAAQQAEQQLDASMRTMVSALQQLDQKYRTAGDSAKTGLASASSALISTTNAMRQASSTADALAIAMGKVQAAAIVTDREFQALVTMIGETQSRLLSSRLAATELGTSLEGLGSVVETVSGAGFRELIDEMLVVDQGFKSAAESASVFVEALGPVGTQVTTVASAGFSRMVEDLVGVKNSLNDAQASALAMAAALDELDSQVKITDTDFQRMVEQTGNLNQRLLSAQMASTECGTAMGSLGNKVQTVANNALRDMIDNLTGVSTSARLAATESVALAQQFGAIEGAETRVRGVNTGLIREMIVGFREVLTGNLSRLPGTLMVAAERMQALTTKTMVAVGAMGALAFAVAGVVREINNIHMANVGVEAASVGTLLTQKDAVDLRDRLRDVSNVTQEESTKIVTDFTNMAGAVRENVAFFVDSLQPISNKLGETGAEVAQKFRDGWENPLSQSTAQLMVRLGATQQQIDAMRTATVADQRKTFMSVIYDEAKKINEQVPEAARNLTLLGRARDALQSTLTGISEMDSPWAVDKDSIAQSVDNKKYADDFATAQQHVNGVIADTRQETAEWGRVLEQTLETAKNKAFTTAYQSGESPQKIRIAELQAEIAVMQQSATTANATADEKMIANRKLMEMQEQLGLMTASANQKAERDSTQAALAAYDAREKMAGADLTKVLEIEDEKLEYMRSAGMEATAAYQREVGKRAEIANKAAAQEVKVETDKVEESIRLEQIQTQEMIKTMNAKVSQGQLTKDQAVQQIVDQMTQERDQAAQTLQDLIDKLTKGTQAYQQAADKRATIIAQMNEKIQAIQAQATTQDEKIQEAQAKFFTTSFQSIGDDWERTVGGLLTHTETWVSAQKSLLKTIGDAFFEMTGHMLAQWITNEVKMTASTETQDAVRKAQESGGSGLSQLISNTLAQWLGLETKKTAISEAGNTQRTTQSAVANMQQTAQQQAATITQIGSVTLGQQAQTAATVTGTGERKALEGAANSQSVMGSAAAAAAGAYKALAGVPLIGPILGAGAAAATFAAVMAYNSLASLDVGAWNVPEDMVAQIHKNEMVVPATFASQLRSNMTGAGVGSNQSSLTYAPTIHLPSGSVAGGLSRADLSAIMRSSRKELDNTLRQWSPAGGSRVLPGR